MSYAINESQREDAFIIMAAYCLIPNLYIQTAKKKKKLVLKTLKSKTLANRG